MIIAGTPKPPSLLEKLRAAGCTCTAVTEDRLADGMVRVEYEYGEPDFDEMSRLSTFFGTTKINVGTEIRESGYCDTCRSTDSVPVLTIWDIPEDKRTP